MLEHILLHEDVSQRVAQRVVLVRDDERHIAPGLIVRILHNRLCIVITYDTSRYGKRTIFGTPLMNVRSPTLYLSGAISWCVLVSDALRTCEARIE